jgi:hypothetical protein
MAADDAAAGVGSSGKDEGSGFGCSELVAHHRGDTHRFFRHGLGSSPYSRTFGGR